VEIQKELQGQNPFIHQGTSKIHKMIPISIITVGGTIDKVYFDAKSEYEVGPPNAEKVLNELNLSIQYTVLSLLRKDSLDMTDEDRKLLYTTVAKDPAAKILVTHGTDTMVETAKYLSAIKGKTIVLTGALEPALFKTSDATFNIGCAIGALQVLGEGAYIVMNGRVFPADNVRKNLDTNRFEPLFQSPETK
jgi:L-asparaginase